MPNVGDIIRAADFSGAGIKAGAVVPFYNVTLSGRYPIFWGESEADTSWLVCDGGSDLHGGNVPNLSNRFIMGVTSVSAAKKTGGAATVALTTANLPSHTHSLSGVSTSSSGAHSHYTGMLCDCNETTNSQWNPSIYGTTSNGIPGKAKATVATNTGKSKVSQSITGSGGSEHYHTLSGSIGSTGSGTAHENLPPYYSLIYLVKLP